MDDRVDWVDYAKGIGIILVVYGHVLRGLHSAGFKFFGRFYELSDSIVYSFHMPLFFFLSGLFFYQTLSKKGPVKLVFSKIDTIFYPFVIWSILQGSIEVLVSNYTNGNVTFNEVFSLLWSPRAQFWFLYDLFFVIVISSFIFKVNARGKVLFLLPLFSFLYVVFLDSEYVKLIFLYCVFFMLGIIFSFYFKSEWLHSKTLQLISALAFIVFQYLYHFYYELHYLDLNGFTMFIAFVSVFFVIFFSSFLARLKVTFLCYLGSVSMVIYLMHILAGSGVRVILDRVLGIDSVVFHLVFGLISGLFFPLVVLWFLKRLNVRYAFSAPVSKFFTYVGKEVVK